MLLRLLLLLLLASNKQFIEKCATGTRVAAVAVAVAVAEWLGALPARAINMVKWQQASLSIDAPTMTCKGALGRVAGAEDVSRSLSGLWACPTAGAH